jgi:hypothetical protein
MCRPLKRRGAPGAMVRVHDLPLLALGFVSLLLLPALGVAGLFKQKLTPILGGVIFIWLLGGVWALSSGWHAGMTEARFLRLWLVGLTLGGGLYLVARLREKRRTWKWIRLLMTVTTVVVFVRALYSFFKTYG